MRRIPTAAVPLEVPPSYVENAKLLSCWKSGAEGQNRTVDTSLFRAVLCQLSYLGTEMEAGWHCYRND